MKKQICGMTLLMATSALCYAQSSVTLYGAVDDGFTFTNNQSGHHNYQASNGALGSSKWGFLINEDLGNGYRAVARLENGFDINTGKFNNGGREFGRQSYVGLTGPQGTLLLGRQYDLVLDALLPLSSAAQFAGILGAHAGDVDNMWGDYSFSNSVKYISPTYAGFKISGLFSLGGTAGAFANGKKDAISVTYNRGPLSAGAVFSQANNPATSLYDATAAPTAGGTFVNPITNPTFSGYTSARTVQVAGVGANYKFGAAEVGFIYTNTRFQDVLRTSSTPFSGTAVFNNYEALASYRITPSFLVGLSYDYTKAETAKYGQVNFGTQYSLSKRTLVYAIAAWEKASGTDSTGKQAVAALTFLTPSSTSNQVAIRIGMRHAF